MVDRLRENDSLVNALGSAVRQGTGGLDIIPKLVLRVIDEDRWQERITKLDTMARFAHFEQFVMTPPIDGLGSSVDMLIRLCKDDKDALDAIDRAMKRPNHRPEKTVDNVHSSEERPTGNTEQAAIRRLRKDRPDLHKKVIAGKMSAHAAMVEAGFRKRTITIPTEPADAARAILRAFTGDRLEAFKRALEG